MGLAQARLNLLDDATASLLKQREAGDDPDNETLLSDVYAAKGMKKEAEASAKLKPRNSGA